MLPPAAPRAHKIVPVSWERVKTVSNIKDSAQPRGAHYQVFLVALLSLNFGILFFDRNALNFVMPFVKPDLGLTNTQVGLTASALSFAWALSALFVGAAADRSGQRKTFLIAATIAFSLCSFISGLASSFLMLLGSRLLMGLAEGGVAPISQTITALAVSPARRGLAMGVMQNFGSNLLGSFAAPVLLVAFATAFGWHKAFYLAGIPGLLSAFLLWRFIDEPATVAAASLESRQSLRSRLREIFAHRNMLLCVFISILLVSYLVICWAFTPLFLTKVRGFAPAQMGWLMGTLGLSATLGSFIVSGISDRVGRRPVIVFTCFLGLILPLGALFYQGSIWILAAIFFFGWALTGAFPLFMGTIPSETVSARHMTTAMAIIIGSGEVVGGVISPAAAGWAADLTGLGAPLWIMMGLCSGAGVLALALSETAPACRKTRNHQGEVASAFTLATDSDLNGKNHSATAAANDPIPMATATNSKP
jgi:ACS family hexuronate transporter-like MFS transporter